MAEEEAGDAHRDRTGWSDTDGELRRQLATLCYSQVSPATTADAVAAAGWWNLLARLGFRLPLVVVHDFGLLLSGGRFGRAREVRRDGGSPGGIGAPAMGRYQACWRGSPNRRRSRSWGRRRCATRRWR